MAEIPNKSPGFFSLQVKPGNSNPVTVSRQQPSIINIPISNLPPDGLSTGAVTINQSPVMTSRLDQSRSSIFIPGISHRENLGSNIKILNIEDLPLLPNASTQPMGNIIIGSSELLRSSEPKYQTIPSRQNISLDKLIQTSLPSQISSSITLHRTGVSNAPSQPQNVVIQVAAPERSQV